MKSKWQFIFVHGLEKLIWLKWHPQVDQDIQCNHFWNPKGLFFIFICRNWQTYSEIQET